ncbi:MAG: hypothetical protein M2R45_02615 [Verrucomicrobia subdivision 3 bacterium]|nr:hypothetical protein [Limisphaerales bacterium]MCS1416417.1 hypothetical protein [Limisphaerales bacterium]
MIGLRQNVLRGKIYQLTESRQAFFTFFLGNGKRAVRVGEVVIKKNHSPVGLPMG